MYYKWLFLFLILFFIIYSCNNKKENFDNCPGISGLYNDRINFLKNKKYGLLLGFNPNDYIYKTLLMDSNEPIPVNANFWLKKF